MRFAPGTDGSADKFGSVIDMNFLRQTTRVRELLEYADNAQAWEACVCLNGQALSGVFVQDGQHTKGTTVRQGVADKVHSPSLVCPLEAYRCGGGKPLPTVPTLASSHGQPELSIHPVNPLVINAPPLSPKQNGQSAVAESLPFPG
jgi:hypothetical protein